MARWFVGCDHAGLALKRQLLAVLVKWGDEVEDLGTNDESSVDYPAYGAEVGKRVASHPGTKGLVVCGSGIGISIAANKVPGVRAALVQDPYSAQMARAHNDCNVIALGGRTIGAGMAEAALRAFRDTPFEGGRHQRRVDQLAELDRLK
ncbi:MAG: ribose 5-phosphate isomerase B [Myxococcales bacterium]|nr:ribose 5-phosphate isomerase B [Myxococcales bacterium]HRC58664.1 ribose 5-phosphate isomerase B [Kofleriaceae bacterium]